MSIRDLIVKLAVKLGIYKSLVELANKLQFKIQARRMRKFGLQMLDSADKAFSSLGVKTFLTFGTLLGAYRDHGFISYDPDIDLGVLSDEVPSSLHETMEKYGFKLLKQIVLAENKVVVEETYIYNKLHLDVFYYMREGSDFYTVIQQGHETKDWKEANVTDGFPCNISYVSACDFERRNFLGLKIYMPVETDKWLRDMYSDSYMTPIKNWNATDYQTRNNLSDKRTYRIYY